MTRPALSVLPGGDVDQVLRLNRFRAADPGLVIGPLESGWWQARIPGEDSETVITRYHLEDLLDQLAALLGEPGC